MMTVVAMLLLASCEQSEQSKIEEVSSNFIQGRLALASNDSSLLRATTNDSLYRMIMLNYRFIKLINGRYNELQELRMMRPEGVTINGDNAVCKMMFIEPYHLNLRKYGDTWKVCGENDKYPSEEAYQRTLKKYEEQAVIKSQRPLFDSVIKVVNDFYMSAKYNFHTPKPEMLKPSCSDDVIALLERIKKVAFDKLGKDVVLAEMGHEDFTPGDIEKVGETVVFRLYQEPTKLTLKLVNGNYQIIGINDSDKLKITDETIAINLVYYLRAMKIVRGENYRDKRIKNFV